MVYKPKRIIKLGRNCPDFEPCKRKVELHLPNIGVIATLETDLEGNPLDETTEKVTADKPILKKVVIDCEFSEGCGDRINYVIPPTVRSIPGILPLGACVGVRFTKEDERLLRENLATLDSGLEEE